MTLSLDGDVIQDQVIELISQYGYEADVILGMKVRDQSLNDGNTFLGRWCSCLWYAIPEDVSVLKLALYTSLYNNGLSHFSKQVHRDKYRASVPKHPRKHRHLKSSALTSGIDFWGHLYRKMWQLFLEFGVWSRGVWSCRLG